MKLIRTILWFICICLLLTSVFFGVSAVASSEKNVIPKDIAIVFDNSGSMYFDDNTAWCRATYAMEIFASMLNDKDTLSIYPMYEIIIEGNSYTQARPFKITGPKRASEIRDIYTPNAGGTPIESIDAAYNGLKNAAGEKWLIVLTDGTYFHMKNLRLSPDDSISELNKRFDSYISDMNIIYLGIGADALQPKVSANSSYRMVVEKAADSKDVLAKLTQMCNLIFGRDTIPASHISGDKLDFDISMNKMIVFVQGENVSGVSVVNSSGDNVGKLESAVSTMYSTKGSDEGATVDNKLQGMIVTYTDCSAGDYSIKYSGSATSVEVYYEPNVEMSFLFTDAEGVEVRPDQLYEGDYVIQYGMMDGKTGEFTESDLLGDTRYSGHYSVNGNESGIESANKRGSTKVSLKEGDSFNADMTVRYLSGYEIHKEGSAFGWPLSVGSKPAGELELRISGGESQYELASLEGGAPYRAEVYYQGEKLTGDELRKTEITWDADKSGAVVNIEFRDDHYEITLSHREPGNPEKTPVGDFAFPFSAAYKAEGTAEAHSKPVQMAYSIKAPEDKIQVRLVSGSYFTVNEFQKGTPVRAEITLNGSRLTPEEFNSVNFVATCDGIPLSTKAVPEESAYLIYPSEGADLKTGFYRIKCEVTGEDEIGRPITDKAETLIELGLIPGWLRWLLILLAILLLIIIILAILHIKALPQKVNPLRRDSTMLFDGEDDTRNTVFKGDIAKKTLSVFTKRGGKKFGVTMSVKPGDGSYIRTPQHKRVALVDNTSVRPVGGDAVKEIFIGSAHYTYDDDTRKWNTNQQRPFNVKQGTTITYSGKMRVNGELKDFYVKTKVNFKKSR